MKIDVNQNFMTFLQIDDSSKKIVMIVSNKIQTNHKKINSRTQFDPKNFITKIH